MRVRARLCLKYSSHYDKNTCTINLPLDMTRSLLTAGIFPIHSTLIWLSKCLLRSEDTDPRTTLIWLRPEESLTNILEHSHHKTQFLHIIHVLTTSKRIFRSFLREITRDFENSNLHLMTFL